MNRSVSSTLNLDVTSTADLVFSIACADLTLSGGSESLKIELDGEPIPAVEFVDAHGTRLHRVLSGPGALTVTYEAAIPLRVEPIAVEPTEVIQYLRPSRYCESDSLGPTAHATFAGLDGMDLLEAVGSWVGTQLAYVSGSSLPTDGAVRTLLARKGVCRDFAHLSVALLRAMNVPARLVSVYAPGLSPMDFHAVCEAHVDGRWYVVDPTTLAPRQSMIRIATGRDAADTAFLTVLSGTIDLEDMEVTAVVDSLPEDDVREPIQLG